ncbi:ATPase family AAA domain-containing protein 2-like isoform X2 [Alosa alosa]|uniref:ATPase family AAA domain-containing protein 2-like isoform X2 n=1 Tax=Alosa alosa TaxID=278164 RepID=UPI0020153464|nr:ATPase family AAA domain-containing protein 2-like isoform X2 [Alosa alosa]
MVMLRRSTGGTEPAAAGKSVDMDSSSEFLSLHPPQRKSARLKRGLDDSFSSADSSPGNAYLAVKKENGAEVSIRTKGQREKSMVTFADLNGSASDPQQSEDQGKHFLRKSPRLQTEGKTSQGEQSDNVEDTPTSRKHQGALRERDVDSALRRSSRITRYKLSARNQSVLYDRLITNTAEAVLQKMDDMQKMRRRLRSRDGNDESLRIFQGAKRKRSTGRTDESEENQENGNGDFSEVEGDEEDDDDNHVEGQGEEEENDGADEDEEDDEDEDDEGEEEEEDDEDEDEEEDNQRRYDLRQRKAVVRYQPPMEEPKKRSIFFKRHSSPSRRRYSFPSSGPRSPYSSRRGSRTQTHGRRHAIHSSDSTSSSSSSDDDTFERRRSKNRNRSINRCLPLNLRKDDLLGIQKDRMKIGTSLADVDPMQIDQTVRFDSIGGLTRHISSLKEMVVFPLLYPEVFERFKIQPPRGCLFYGPPGTGKTLVARALANECSQGDKKVAFFMRKGADCLSKWVGESERQLRLLFDQAYQMRPAIIFFDEIDGLAPVRSSRQDQIHSSIVSTLLALMDGLDSRGEVVVIGATNRLDSIDPALRRPGRFDREFLFGLPDRDARKDILKIHTRQWNPQPSEAFLEELADKCVGYCGADIKAVCAEAALCALRRRYPQIYASSQKLQLDVASISVGARDFVSAMRRTVPASQRAVVSPAKALAPIVQPLLSATLGNILEVVQRVFPHAEQGLRRSRDAADLASGVLDEELLYSDDEVPPMSITNGPKQAPAAGSFLCFNRSVLQHPTSYRPRLLLSGRPGSGQSSHLAPAVLHALEKFTVYTLDLAVLFGISSTTPEEACAQVFCEAKRTAPSILYIPHLQRWWDTVGPALKATFLSLLSDVPPFSPILLLATCSHQYHALFPEVQDLFRMEYGEVFEVSLPTQQERTKFFKDLILIQAAKAPASKRKAVLQVLEVLPVAPPPPPQQLTEQEQQQLEEQEEDTLRELRLFLRDVTNRLAQDKRFKAFTRPVDLEEVPDYTTVIKQPMDLSTLLSNIDSHKYVTVKDFLHDVDLIWKNCLEYNPDRDPSDRLIRHRACALKDSVHAIIKDQLDEDFEKICQEIKESRSKRGCTASRYAPSYFHVQPKPQVMSEKTSDHGPSKDTLSSMPSAASTPRSAPSSKKRRRKSRWCNGFITKKKSSAHPRDDDDDEDEEEDREGEEEDEEKAEAMDAQMEQEEEALRKLCSFLCDVTDRLAQDKRFQAFTEPVDPEEVPDYSTVIKQPMDLSTVLSNINSHKYTTAKDFLLDVDLIWINALEYNPETDPEGRLIRKQALALKATVHDIIKAEMDEELEEFCQKIQESRSSRANDLVPGKDDSAPATLQQTAQKRRRRKKRWSSGYIAKKKSRDTSTPAESVDDEDDEEEEEHMAGDKDGEEEHEKAKMTEPANDEAAAAASAMETEEAVAVETEEGAAMESEEAGPVTVEGGEDHNPTSPLADALVNGHTPSEGGDQLEEQAATEPEKMATEIIDVEAAKPEKTEAVQPEPEMAKPDRLEPERAQPEVEQDAGIEIGKRRMTRALKNQVQQQQVISLEAAMKILEQKTPPLVVDHSKLQDLLHKVVAKTEGYDVDRLEKLYALLCQSVYRHRKEYDKTTLLQEMEKEIEDFE